MKKVTTIIGALSIAAATSATVQAGADAHIIKRIQNSEATSQQASVTHRLNQKVLPISNRVMYKKGTEYHATAYTKKRF